MMIAATAAGSAAAGATATASTKLLNHTEL